MKKFFLLVLFSVSALAQSPEPIVVPKPVVIQVTQPVELRLSPAQLQEVATILASVVTLPTGIVNINLHILTTGTNAGGAFVKLTFQ